MTMESQVTNSTLRNQAAALSGSSTTGLSALSGLASTQFSQSTATIPLTSFSLFPNLPKELQLKIWGFAAYVPQVVRLRAPLDLCDCIGYVYLPKLKVESAPPAILHTCSEARAVASKSYMKWFIGNVEAQSTPKNTVFVNEQVDVVIVRTTQAMEVKDRHKMAQIVSQSSASTSKSLASDQSFPWSPQEVLYSIAYRIGDNGWTEMYLVAKSREACRKMEFVSIYNNYNSVAVEELNKLGMRAYCYSWNETISGTWGGLWTQLSRRY